MTWYSQAGQDAWVHDLIGDSGYFVDVGAHDGVIHSNTYALEQRGWTGVCIEPNEAAYESLKLNRHCEIAGHAISDVHGKIRFDGVRVSPGAPWTSCTTLTTLLDCVGAPSIIDYLSVDVEGHELQVLAGMDWERWHVRCITIEHNLYCDGPARKDAIFAVLARHGFERVREDVAAEGYGEYEDWYRSVFEKEMRALRVLDAVNWPGPR